jgi:hypothetical protein
MDDSFYILRDYLRNYQGELQVLCADYTPVDFWNSQSIRICESRKPFFILRQVLQF